jgi:tetraacyldisaccharide 4'-kinase
MLAGYAEVPVAWYVRRRNAAYDKGRASITKVAAPVVSLGNLTVGGTGKTPFVAWLAEWFEEQGEAVTIISRGYGSRRGPNDEAKELALRLPNVPHLQNPDRVAAAKEALKQNDKQVLLLDDAFQHRRIARDLDIVLLDALDPFGCGHLLPRGLLREPPEGLRRAHIVALSRADAISLTEREAIREQVEILAPQADWIEVVHRPTHLRSASGAVESLDQLRQGTVAAFCGLGNPEGFRHTLESLHVSLAGWKVFPDHCPYRPHHVHALKAWLQRLAADRVVCTMKDLVKLPHTEIASRPLWGLAVEMDIVVGKEKLEARLQSMSRSA